MRGAPRLPCTACHAAHHGMQIWRRACVLTQWMPQVHVYGEQLSALGLRSKTIMMVGKRTIRQATAKGAASASLPGLVHVPAQVSAPSWSQGTAGGASSRYRWRSGVCPAVQGSQTCSSCDHSGPSLRSSLAFRGCYCACVSACTVAGTQAGQGGQKACR